MSRQVKARVKLGRANPAVRWVGLEKRRHLLCEEGKAGPGRRPLSQGARTVGVKALRARTQWWERERFK